jgi:hypothetical protein
MKNGVCLPFLAVLLVSSNFAMADQFITKTSALTRVTLDKNLTDLADMNAGQITLTLCADDTGTPIQCKNGDRGTLQLDLCQRDPSAAIPASGKPCEGARKVAQPFLLPLNDYQHTSCMEEFALATLNDPASPTFKQEEVQVLDRTASVCSNPHNAPVEPLSVRLTVSFKDASGKMIQTSSEIMGPGLVALVAALPLKN